MEIKLAYRGDSHLIASPVIIFYGDWTSNILHPATLPAGHPVTLTFFLIFFVRSEILTMFLIVTDCGTISIHVIYDHPAMHEGILQVVLESFPVSSLHWKNCLIWTTTILLICELSKFDHVLITKLYCSDQNFVKIIKL